MEYSEEEEGSRDPDSECAPLIDPWYDTHMHFLTVPGDYLPPPLGSSTSLGWKEWADEELSGVGFMVTLQQAGMLKAIVSSCCLSNYRDLFNLHHLLRRWCTSFHTFFFSCSEITMTLEDVLNQLLLPILGNVDPSNIELSPKEEAVEAELKKGMSGNMKLSH